MNRIIVAAESDPEFWSYFKSRSLPHDATSEDAISHSVRGIAEIMSCAAVFGYTMSGSTVQRISRERPPCRIIGVTPFQHTANRLALSWGVEPMVTSDPTSFDDMLTHINEIAKERSDCAPGDRIMICAGIPFGRPGKTDTLKIATIE